MEATVPGGGSYTGTIAARPVGESLELSWDTTAGRYFGIGLEEGGAWYVACGEDGIGLGLALLGPGGTLRWTPAPARGRVGFSALVPAPAAAGILAWEAGPQSPSGLPFTRVSLRDGVEVAEAELTGGAPARGLCLPTAAGWAIAWSPAFEQTVVLSYRAGREPGTWAARWALGGRPGTAVELLRPLL